ncbi:mitochondrial enolase superfamily member 1-like isoform X2 [Macrosteles quadrilineatus]|nr:mitochondrial enolase superfamily member 1-like isoform X2 [Macrosteles quadrilineatus]
MMIRSVHARDIRFPTSLEAHGSDAMHKDPDYSCAYVVIYTDKDVEGHGLAFTLGRGTEIVVAAIKALSPLLVGQFTNNILTDFGGFWQKLTSDSQLRWLGPEKGVIHLAAAAIVNALWDLWARIENKPLWKLLVDLDPEDLVSTIDFRYISDVLTKQEALEILKQAKEGKQKREEIIKTEGYPAYTTQAGWLGYSSDKVRSLLSKYMAQGFSAFKIKVGDNLEDDIKRSKMVREIIGPDRILMMDANQKWDVGQAVKWMEQLAVYKPLWIEEPTSPDDILGHTEISKALSPLGVGVATGEMICNRVMFKQFLQLGAMQYCQIDACRVGGVNELLAIYLMAHKFKVPVCPHAGGVGLCEMVQHLQIFDYIALSGTMEHRMIEYVDKLHEQFEEPVVIKQAKYQVPKVSYTHGRAVVLEYNVVTIDLYYYNWVARCVLGFRSSHHLTSELSPSYSLRLMAFPCLRSENTLYLCS